MASEFEIHLTWGAQLARAERILAATSGQASRHEATEMLSYVLGIPEAELLACPTAPLDLVDAQAYERWVARCATGEALPHITGHLEFMGLDLLVQPEDPLPPLGAQRLVEIALQRARRRDSDELLAAEVGTGCGAIALALAVLEPRFIRIYAVDSSPSALQTADANGARYLLNLVIGWLQGDGAEVVPEPVDLLVSARLKWTGLSQVIDMLRPGGALICVVTSGQRQAAAEWLARCFPTEPVWIEVEGNGDAIFVASRALDLEEV
jgi:release factor glutamine methyltransferase